MYLGYNYSLNLNSKTDGKQIVLCTCVNKKSSSLRRDQPVLGTCWLSAISTAEYSKVLKPIILSKDTDHYKGKCVAEQPTEQYDDVYSRQQN